MPTTFSRTTRSLTHDSSKYSIMAWCLGGAFLAGWLLWFYAAEVTVYEISPKARLQVNHSSYPISALTAGKIVATNLVLGQEVHEGDVLLTLDASNDQLRLQEEESKLAAIPPQIALLENQITLLMQAQQENQKAAEAAVLSAQSRQAEASSAAQFAADNARRLEELSAQGEIPLIESLRARSETQQRSSNRQALLADIDRLKKEAQNRVHQEQAEIKRLQREIAHLQGDLNTTQITITRLQQEIERHLIRAPANGQIGDIAAIQVGTYINVGEKLGAIVPHSKLRIVADFPPAAVLGRVHAGQEARLRLDGFPWAQFGTINAKVSSVGSEIRDNQVRVEFNPELELDSPIVLQHGLPGAIEVSIEKVSPAILVLRAAGQLMAQHKAPLPNIIEEKH